MFLPFAYILRHKYFGHGKVTKPVLHVRRTHRRKNKSGMKGRNENKFVSKLLRCDVQSPFFSSLPDAQSRLGSNLGISLREI